jgi:hypothetical protein
MGLAASVCFVCACHQPRENGQASPVLWNTARVCFVYACHSHFHGNDKLGWDELMGETKPMDKTIGMTNLKTF